MNAKEIITSGLLESYVLGQTTAEETALVQSLLSKDPELEKEIEAIEQSLLDLSAKAAPPLKKELKDQIYSKLHFHAEENQTNIIPVNANDHRLYKFGMAASLLLFVTSLVYNILQNQRLQQAYGELAQMNAERSFMADQMNVQQTSLTLMKMELQVLADPMVKTVALKGMKSMENHSAMVHWNTHTEEVYFNASVLPQRPDDKQYQLWAIVDGKPVDAGMIDLSATAAVFQKMRSIKGAQAFAVTVERIGGSDVPTMETMCLLGNV